jgi:hypothetical protein
LVPWLVLWPLIPIGVPVGLAAVILIAIVGLLIVVAGAVIWMLGYVLVGLGWSEAEALMGAGGGIALAMFRALERMNATERVPTA